MNKFVFFAVGLNFRSSFKKSELDKKTWCTLVEGVANQM